MSKTTIAPVRLPAAIGIVSIRATTPTQWSYLAGTLYVSVVAVHMDSRTIILDNLMRWMYLEPEVTDKGWLRELSTLGWTGREAEQLLNEARSTLGHAQEE